MEISWWRKGLLENANWNVTFLNFDSHKYPQIFCYDQDYICLAYI